jgi:hypothetical protein
MFGSANIDNHTRTSTRSSRDGEPGPGAGMYAYLPASASALVPGLVVGTAQWILEGVEACGYDLTWARS